MDTFVDLSSVIETSDGWYYMDEDAARWFMKRRWRVMLTFLAVVIIGFAILNMLL